MAGPKHLYTKIRVYAERDIGRYQYRGDIGKIWLSFEPLWGENTLKNCCHKYEKFCNYGGS
jgi:hypothetical protein